MAGVRTGKIGKKGRFGSFALVSMRCTVDVATGLVSAYGSCPVEIVFDGGATQRAGTIGEVVIEAGANAKMLR